MTSRKRRGALMVGVIATIALGGGGIAAATMGTASAATTLGYVDVYPKGGDMHAKAVEKCKEQFSNATDAFFQGDYSDFEVWGCTG